MIWSPVVFAGVDCKSEQLRARRDPTARRQLQGSSAALHPGAEGLRRVRMEADARVAKLALQLPFMQVSESMGNHDSKIVDAASVD